MISVLNPKLRGSIDGPSSSTAFASIDIGVFYVAGNKNAQRRCWFLFDLYDPSLVRTGAAVRQGSRIIQAFLVLGTQTAWHPATAPFPPFAAHLYRLTRTDMDGTGTTWNNYKTGSAWTGTGGDYDAGPSATAVAFSTPALGNLSPPITADSLPDSVGVADEYIDCTAIVQDAQLQRGGLVAMIARLDNESPGNPNDTFQQFYYGPTGGAGFLTAPPPRLQIQTLNNQIGVA